MLCAYGSPASDPPGLSTSCRIASSNRSSAFCLPVLEVFSCRFDLGANTKAEPSGPAQ